PPWPPPSAAAGPRRRPAWGIAGGPRRCGCPARRARPGGRTRSPGPAGTSSHATGSRWERSPSRSTPRLRTVPGRPPPGPRRPPRPSHAIQVPTTPPATALRPWRKESPMTSDPRSPTPADAPAGPELDRVRHAVFTARAVQEDPRWAEDALVAMVFSDVRIDVAEEHLVEAATLVQQSQESPEQLYGP